MIAAASAYLEGRYTKIHRPFGEFGLYQDVIEADHAVRAVGELVCCGGDESLACGVGSSFAGLSHRPACLVAVAAQRPPGGAAVSVSLPLVRGLLSS